MTMLLCDEGDPNSEIAIQRRLKFIREYLVPLTGVVIVQQYQVDQDPALQRAIAEGSADWLRIAEHPEPGQAEDPS